MQQKCCIAACIDKIPDMRYLNGMDQPALTRTIWDLCNELVTKENSRRRTGGSNVTHQFDMDDLGISVTRVSTIGIVNQECITISHQSWQAVVERTWPDWDSDDRDKRMFGNVSFSISGDTQGPIEALTWLRMQR